MKKSLLILLLIVGFIGFSQEQDCKFDYNVNVKLGKPDKPWDAFAILDYDFSRLNLKTENVQIEVVGILDCWNSLDGAQLRDTVVVLDSNNKDFEKKGVVNLEHNSLKAKCFKYRVVAKSGKCEEVSDWKFVTY